MCFKNTVFISEGIYGQLELYATSAIKLLQLLGYHKLKYGTFFENDKESIWGFPGVEVRYGFKERN